MHARAVAISPDDGIYTGRLNYSIQNGTVAAHNREESRRRPKTGGEMSRSRFVADALRGPPSLRIRHYFRRVSRTLAAIWLEAVMVIREDKVTTCVQFGGQVAVGPRGIRQMACARVLAGHICRLHLQSRYVARCRIGLYDVDAVTAPTTLCCKRTAAVNYTASVQPCSSCLINRLLGKLEGPHSR